MTGTEFYYLLMCIGAFLVFALTLAYNGWSWKRHHSEMGASDRSEPDRISHAGSHSKLAA